MALNRNEVLAAADNIVVPRTTLKRTLFGPNNILPRSADETINLIKTYSGNVNENVTILITPS